mmetsp:Transcript_23182/g.75096  ORF Transcript_23182/g.75096 Transcript_23182/m.75096 type:complete len:209 (-) Transcript_23182:310-936(-)
MKSHSASDRKPDSTNTVGRSDTVVISTSFSSACSSSPTMRGMGTCVTCPSRTPGHRNWPPVKSHTAAPLPKKERSAAEVTGPPDVVKRRHALGSKSYSEPEIMLSTGRNSPAASSSCSAVTSASTSPWLSLATAVSMRVDSGPAGSTGAPSASPKRAERACSRTRTLLPPSTCSMHSAWNPGHSTGTVMSSSWLPRHHVTSRFRPAHS